MEFRKLAASHISARRVCCVAVALTLVFAATAVQAAPLTSSPPGFLAPHQLSRVAAFTLGYTRDVNSGMRARVGIGGDVTTYYVPDNLEENYGGPVSLRLFVRVRFPAKDPMAGMNH